MKKLKNLYLPALIFLLTFENVYADTINVELDLTTIITILCVILVVIGLSLIVVGKIGEKRTKSFEFDEDPDDHEIVGLKDTTKIDKSFDPDSIFKEIPTFSNKKFYDTTGENLKKKLLKEDDELIEINIIDKKIKDFNSEESKYIITSEYAVEVKKEIEKDRYKYIVTSEKSKEIPKEPKTRLTSCPTCGGKIKDYTLKRCKHCGSPLEKENKESMIWKITKLEKMD